MERQWEERTKKETQTGANGSPRGVDDRHEGDLRIIHCESIRYQTFRAPIIPRQCPGRLSDVPGNNTYTRQGRARSTIAHHPLSTNKFFAFALMSHSRTTASGSSSTNFQLVLNNALKAYEKRTKKNLLSHPLASQLQDCHSPGDIIAVLQQQIQGPNQSGSADERWTKWLNPTINVLLAFSQTVGTVGLVCDALIRDLTLLYLYLAGILTHDGYLRRNRRSAFGEYPY
jgi:hypothetical protein